MSTLTLSSTNVGKKLWCAVIAFVAALPVSVWAQDHSEMGIQAPQEADPHVGHAVPPPMQQERDHPAMDHAVPQQPANLPREPIPPITPADRAAAFPDVEGHAVHDKSIHYYALFNRLETWNEDASSGFAWEGQGWVGSDLNRLWVRTEGERVEGVTEAADVEVLYGRATARWWDVVAGIRHDFQPDGESQTFAAIGVMGLAPYKFEVAATAYLGESGQIAADLEVEYELLLTNRLILQPSVEIELSGEDDEQRGVGSGLSNIEAGLRLRYEIRREFAPYIGVSWEKAIGSTADYAHARGEATGDRYVVLGLRTWF